VKTPPGPRNFNKLHQHQFMIEFCENRQRWFECRYLVTHQV
jgi:hypothetical protein